MRRRSWSLLLPLLLLFAQQGALRHELSHLPKPSLVCLKEAPAAQDHCSLCRAFAHLSGAAKPETVAFGLAEDLAFAAPAQLHRRKPSLDAPAPRSRGPPLF